MVDMRRPTTRVRACLIDVPTGASIVVWTVPCGSSARGRSSCDRSRFRRSRAATSSCERSAPASAPGTEMLAYRGELPADLDVDETHRRPRRHVHVPVPVRLQLRRPDRGAGTRRREPHGRRSGLRLPAAPGAVRRHRPPTSCRCPALEPRLADAAAVRRDRVAGHPRRRPGARRDGRRERPRRARTARRHARRASRRSCRGDRATGVASRAIATDLGIAGRRSRARRRRGRQRRRTDRDRVLRQPGGARQRRSSCSRTRAPCWSPPGTARVP